MMMITISPHPLPVSPAQRFYKQNRRLVVQRFGHHQSNGVGGLLEMASNSPKKNITTTNHLRHVESMATLPSGAGKIPRLNAVILGEAIASEEDDLVLPNQDFSRQALIPSPQKVSSFFFWFFVYTGDVKLVLCS